jgi:hypothetical protein
MQKVSWVDRDLNHEFYQQNYTPQEFDELHYQNHPRDLTVSTLWFHHSQETTVKRRFWA